MYHSKKIKDVFEELNTNECGLSEEDASDRLKEYGVNSIAQKDEISIFKVILDQFMDPLIYILIFAALITFFIKDYIETSVIIAIILINAIVGFIQEYKAEKAMNAIKKLASPKATVIREEGEEKISSEEIVPGDIILLTSGNRVPADARIFEVNELEINESTFTGESLPTRKRPDVLTDENIQIADRKNMAYMGTVVSQGKGKAVVVATGTTTELGKISKQVRITQKSKTPLQKRLADFSLKIAIVSILLTVFVFIIGAVFLKYSYIEMIIFALSMAVGVVPEGLPIVVTITMAIGLKRMADKNAIVRKLIAVETLGSCDYICTDKTGTITENRMTVVKAYANDKEFKIKGVGYEPTGDVFLNDEKVERDEDLHNLLLCGVLCNSSNLYKEEFEWKIDGGPTEGAIIVAAKKFSLDTEEIQYQYKLINEIPFNSKKQYMATIHKKENDCYIFVKGAPEKILCFSGENENKKLKEQYSKMTDSGLRVLGLAMKNKCKLSFENSELEHEATRDLTFLGFVGIMDPPRKGVLEALQSTKKAGIKTVMITGDHKRTAVSIAKQIGIFKDGDIALTGREIDEEGDSFLEENIEKTTVYARVSPEHKLKIVEMLQNAGHTVAVTGDGVNDAPALKKASIGVAMGETGTDVAKEASEMILKDDNYKTIYEAVKVGRIIFDNIQKVIYFLLGTGAGFALIIIFSLLLGFPLPLLATQILWVNLVTNGLQDLALAYEPGEKDITLRPPRNPNEKILNKFILIRLIIVGVVMTIGTLLLFWYKLKSGSSIEYARSTALNTIVFFQFFHVLNSRSFDKSIFQMNPFSNSFLFISLLLALIAQIAVLSHPFLQHIFHTTQLTPYTWLQTILTGATIVIAVEIDKLIRTKNKVRITAKNKTN